jgi:predicted amidohydrolase
MADLLRISLAQAPIAWENKEANLARYGSLIRRLSGQTDLVALPEMFATGFSMNVRELAETMDGTTLAAVGAWAKEYQTAICGSFIAREAGGRYYNRAFFVTPGGETAWYDKRHLFGLAGEDRYFSRGEKQTIVSYLGWNICLQVCYDLRFPVWSRNVGNAYDLLVYVANWPESRIGAWRALLPARAIENQAYVCAANRTGRDDEGREYGGHSLVCSPLGEIVADAGAEEETVCTSLLYKSRADSLRAKFPVWMDADLFNLSST